MTANLLLSYFLSSLAEERLATQAVIASPDLSGFAMTDLD